MDENTLADSVAVGVPWNGEKALRAVRESKGITVNVSRRGNPRGCAAPGRYLRYLRGAGRSYWYSGTKKGCGIGSDPQRCCGGFSGYRHGLKDIVSAQSAAGEPMHISPDLGLLIETFKERYINV